MKALIGADPKKLDDMLRGRASPGRAYLLLDTSGSMAGGEKLASAKDGAEKFAHRAFLKGYRVGLIHFNSRAALLCEPTDAIEPIAVTLARLSPGGTTAMHDAIELAVRHLPDEGPRAIVVVTDGYPNQPTDTLRAASRAKERGIDVLCIGTDDADRAFLAQLASRDDLALHVPSNQLAGTLNRIAGLLPEAR